jgi:hypothetical protein
MTIQHCLNLTGLIFDIIGAIVLFKYGLPIETNKYGSIFLIAEESNIDEIKQHKKSESISKIGILLILLGFIFQFLSSIWTSI